MSFVRVFLLVIFILLISGCSRETGSTSDQTLPDSYIENKGSDTMVNLALVWAEEYRKLHPEVNISVTGGGSGTGLAALANNTVDIANASRAIKAEEIELAKKTGKEPKEYVVARDAIAVIIHPKNPVKELSLVQISAIYRGLISNWKDLGGEDRPIVRLSRETNSGTHVYFLETVIRLGSKTDKSIFSPDTLLLPSSEGIISEVSDNPNAIGYDGLGYITPAVKPIAIVNPENKMAVLPSIETVNSGEYPISRDLFIYTLGEPKEAVKAYLEWIQSPPAQLIVSRLGFVPLVETDNR